MITAIIIFMVLVAAMCIFSVTVVIVDLKRSKREQTPVSESAPAEEPTVSETASESAAAVAVPVGQGQQAIVFSTNHVTHWEKYAMLTAENKARYDLVARHVRKVDGIKNINKDSHEEFRLFGKRIVRLVIRRGIVNCEFSLTNPEFDRYISDNKVSVKQAQTVIRLNSDRETTAAINIADIAVQAVQKERAEKHAKDLERRREARRRAASSADN